MADAFTFRVPRGDSFSIPLEVVDEDGVSVNLTEYDAIECVVWRPEDRQIAMVKDWVDATVGGEGVYVYGDTYAWADLGLTTTNQLQVYFDAADTTLLKEDVYRFDIRATHNDLYSRVTQVTLATGTIAVLASSQGANWTPPVAVPWGPTGPRGYSVLNGIVAPTTEGNPGEFYINTATSMIYGPKVGTVWPAGVSLVGATGATGATGPQGLISGIVAPTTEGDNGDFYIDTVTWYVYGPKAAGVWPAGQALITNGIAPIVAGTTGNIVVQSADATILTPYDLKPSAISLHAGAPDSTPTVEGELVFDSTNHILYMAKGTTSSADWIPMDRMWKAYTGGETYNGVAITMTEENTGACTFTNGWFIPTVTSNGSFLLEFNINIIQSGASTASFYVINGVTLIEGEEFSLDNISSGDYVLVHHTIIGTGSVRKMNAQVVYNSTGRAMSGKIKIASWPTWADPL